MKFQIELSFCHRAVIIYPPPAEEKTPFCSVCGQPAFCRYCGAPLRSNHICPQREICGQKNNLIFK